MALLKLSAVNYSGIYQKDMFDDTINIKGLDLTGKTLKMQVRETGSTTPLLTFQMSDSTLSVTKNAATDWNINLHQDGPDMDIAVGDYIYTIKMYTDQVDNTHDNDDGQTICYGTFQVIEQATEI